MNESTLIRKYAQDAKIPGISVGLITESNTSFFHHGEIKAQSGIVPDENTIYEIASISKTFTSILLAILQKEGLIDINNPVSEYISEFSKPPLDKITLYHLATHTSGLPNIPSKFILANLMAPLKSKNIYGDLSSFTYDDLIRFFVKSKPKPGVSWNYSNGGMGLLGYIFEKITVTSYGNLVKEKICNLLDMKDTGITLTDSQKERLAAGHSYFGKQSEHWIAPALEGAVGLCSTVHDLAKFLKGNMGLINGEILSQMQYCQNTRFVPKMPTVMKNILFPYVGVSFDEMALGWMIVKQDDSREILFYDGGTGAFSSFIGFNPAKKRGVVVLSNKLSKSTHKIGMELLKNISTKPDL